MLSARHRLGSASAVSRVLEAGQKKKIGPLLFFHSPSTEPIRLAAVVSKKIDKRATARNYLRRLIMGQFQQLINTNPTLTGELVLVALYQPTKPVEEITSAINIWAKR